ncbi:hypothetical protein HGRIS_009275 [Hohenbuehelia grisea]|uniref:Extracellular membrane protein CFEM domain-containing protein n=1 Tax=Hohenbuehelia grisea TaxID=104357 RepID=A0ABR3J0T7_9AGAR
MVSFNVASFVSVVLAAQLAAAAPSPAIEHPSTLVARQSNLPPDISTLYPAQCQTVCAPFINAFNTKCNKKLDAACLCHDDELAISLACDKCAVPLITGTKINIQAFYSKLVSQCRTAGFTVQDVQVDATPGSNNPLTPLDVNANGSAPPTAGAAPAGAAPAGAAPPAAASSGAPAAAPTDDKKNAGSALTGRAGVVMGGALAVAVVLL